MIFPGRSFTTQALKGTGVGRRLLSLLRLPFSFWQARRILRREKPRLVVGMGGYISGPVGLAASRLGIPLVIHEQNAILGTTNKLLGRVASHHLSLLPPIRGQSRSRKIGLGRQSHQAGVLFTPDLTQSCCHLLPSSSWEAPKGRIT